MAVTDRINARAAQVDLSALLLSSLAAPVVGLGWCCYWAVWSVGALLRWITAAYLVGFELARERRRAG